MTRPFRAPSPEVLAKVTAEMERVLTSEEVATALATPMTEEEERDGLALIAWFIRRYPTPLARLQSARRAMQQIKQRQPQR